MRGVHVVLEQLILAEGGSAHGALIGEVGRLQRLPMIFRHVVQQLPLINLIHMDWVKLGGICDISPFHKQDISRCLDPC